jgi:hypothetical protein
MALGLNQITPRIRIGQPAVERDERSGDGQASLLRIDARGVPCRHERLGERAVLTP